ITRHVGRGTFLAGRAPESGGGFPADSVSHTSPAELMEARLRIEPALAELIVTNATPADFERMETLARRVLIRDRHTVAPLLIKITDADDEILATGNRQRNEVMKQDGIANGDRRNHDDRRADQRQPITQAFAPANERRQRQGEKRREQQRIGAQPTRHADHRTGGDDRDEPWLLAG